MRILAYGAGNIGCLYAARLAESGQQVTVLARGGRRADLRAGGIRLTEWATGDELTVRLPAIERLEPDDAYDLILLILPRHRVAEALPVLAANRATPSVLFFGNNAAGPDKLVTALGPDRSQDRPRRGGAGRVADCRRGDSGPGGRGADPDAGLEPPVSPSPAWRPDRHRTAAPRSGHASASGSPPWRHSWQRPTRPER